MSGVARDRLAAARAFERMGRYREALDECDAIAEDTDEAYEAAAVRSAALAALGAVKRATAATELRLARHDDPQLRASLVAECLRACWPEAALRLATAGLEKHPDDTGLREALIDAHVMTGAFAAAAQVATMLPPGLNRARAWLQIGELDRAAAEAANSGEPEARLVEARVAAWTGRWERAEALARAVEAPEWIAAAQCVLAAAALVGGDLEASRRALDLALAAEPDDPEAYIAATLLAVAEGDAERAWTHHRASRARARDYVPALELAELAILSLDDRVSPFELNLRGVALRAPELGLQAREDIPASELLAAIARFSGNFTAFPTLLASPGTARRVAIRPDPRTASKRLQRSLQLRGFDALIADFDRLVADYAGHPLSHTHRGEMYLWRGDYPEAARDFEASLTRCERTVWAYIGLATAKVAAGDAGGALATLDDGRQRTFVGRTAPAIRGEALRRVGEAGAAREQLEASIETRPRRASAWVNLALLGHTTGERAVVLRAWRELEALCPTFTRDLALETGGFAEPQPEHLEHALVMMRGNRSSGRLTYFTRDGEAYCADTVRSAVG